MTDLLTDRQRRIAELSAKVDRTAYHNDPDRVARFAQAMDALPPDAKRRWCTSRSCACNGCVNHKPGFAGMSLEDFNVWKNNQ